VTRRPPAPVPGAAQYPVPRPGLESWLEAWLAEQRRHRALVRAETRRHREQAALLTARLEGLRASWLPPCETAGERRAVRWYQPELDELEA
jgi:hypothetical protein